MFLLQSNLEEEDRWEYLLLSRIYAFRGDRDEALKYLAEYTKGGFRFGWHDLS